MNEDRKELEELFEAAEMAAKEKDLMNYYKKSYMNSYPSEEVNGVDYEGERNRVMDVLKEVFSVKTAHAVDALPQLVENDMGNSLDAARTDEIISQPLNKQIGERNNRKSYNYKYGFQDDDFEVAFNPYEYGKGVYDLFNYYMDLKNKKLNDKYKYAMINCLMAQKGPEYRNLAKFASNIKELYDVGFDKNTYQQSFEDMNANRIGRRLGKYQVSDSCDTMVQKYFKKTY